MRGAINLRATRRSSRTLATLGAVTKQTIAGAISTGTHGSGRQSLSHFVANVRMAAYDLAGRPTIYEYEFCSFLARALNRLVAARLHWGKHFPLQYADVAPLYPELDTFRALCRRNDPAGVFRNDYTRRVLGL
jgi:FAD/FMN-containing dehydrogenase